MRVTSFYWSFCPCASPRAPRLRQTISLARASVDGYRHANRFVERDLAEGRYGDEFKSRGSRSRGSTDAARSEYRCTARIFGADPQRSFSWSGGRALDAISRRGLCKGEFKSRGGRLHSRSRSRGSTDIAETNTDVRLVFSEMIPSYISPRSGETAGLVNSPNFVVDGRLEVIGLRRTIHCAFQILS